jgi:hypothetical protein
VALEDLGVQVVLEDLGLQVGLAEGPEPPETDLECRDREGQAQCLRGREWLAAGQELSRAMPAGIE